MDDFYKVKQINIDHYEDPITQKEKFIAAKQILLGISILYILTIGAYLINPKDGNKLLDICRTTFPPLANIILFAYFREKG